MKVVIVDDDNLVSISLKTILEASGNVTIAGIGNSGIQAIELYEEHQPDILLMDIQMPVINGYDATRAIRAMDREYCKNVPIIAMTANAFQEDVIAAKAAGMNEHIAKPIDLKSFGKTLKIWLK